MPYTALVSEFEAIAADYPVFRIDANWIMRNVQVTFENRQRNLRLMR